MTTTSINLKPEQVQEQLSAEQLQLRDLLSPVLNPKQEIGLICGCLAVFTLPEPPAESDNPLDHAPSYFELEGPATDPQMAYELTLTAAEYWQAQAGRMPLQELCALLRAVFLGAEGQDVAQEAGRLFDALASVPLLPVPEASGGAGEVVRNDTPERSYRQELVSADGQVYASIEVEADTEGHPVPVGLTVHRGVLLEAYGEDEADVVLALSRAEARALAGGLEAAAGVENL